MDKEIAIITGGLDVQRAASAKVLRKVEALNDALSEAWEADITVEMWSGKQSLKLTQTCQVRQVYEL